MSNISVVEEYVFPYHLFNKNDNVIIYGAGNVGKKLYYQAIRENIVHISGIVDARAKDMKEDISVLPPDVILQMEYDALLVAIENEKIAVAAVDILIEMGVPRNKIKWDGTVYRKENYCKKAYECNKFFMRMMTTLRPRFFLFMLPEHGNMGDYAIAYAEERFFEKYFPEYDLVKITTEEWVILRTQIKSFVNEKDVLFISGGGYFGDLWGSGSICKEIVEEFPKNRKIFLPNNLTYKEEISKQNERLNQDIKWLEQQPETYIFFRTKSSYEYMKNDVKRCFFAPDMVFFMHFPRDVKKATGKVLLCLRNDKEKQLQKRDEIKKTLEKNGYQWSESDIHLQKRILYEDGKYYLNEIIKNIQNHDFVITDRLHGMLLSVVSEVPCIVFDNTTHKVSGVYDSMQNMKAVNLISEEEIQTIPQMISEVIKKDANYHTPEDAFDKMAQVIRGIIS